MQTEVTARPPDVQISNSTSNSEEAKYSKRIADLVISGWTLLDQFCPIHGAVPLVADPDGRMFSVAQNAYVNIPKDGAVRGRTSSTSGPLCNVSLSSAPLLTHDSKDFDNEGSQPLNLTTSCRDVWSKGETGSKFNIEQNLMTEEQAHLLLPMSLEADRNVNILQLIEKTQQTLVAKLNTAQTCLVNRGKDPTKNVDTSDASLVAFIRECSEALVAVRKVRQELRKSK